MNKSVEEHILLFSFNLCSFWRMLLVYADLLAVQSFMLTEEATACPSLLKGFFNLVVLPALLWIHDVVSVSLSPALHKWRYIKLRCIINGIIIKHNTLFESQTPPPTVDV